MLNEDIDLLINRSKFSRTQINNYKARDQAYKQNLNLLKKQLQLLEAGSLDEYKLKQIEIENEWKDRLNIIQTWYETKKNEIEGQFDIEYKNAVNEYQAKKKELKDNLKNEYDDKRKLIEAEKNNIDINMDITDAKPTVTRKLRRRANEQQPVLATSSNLLLTTILNPAQNSIAATSSQVGGATSTQTTNYFSQTIPSYLANERKRRPSPATQISCSLNDDEINEDLKYLNKNLNLIPDKVLSALNDVNNSSSNDEQVVSSINKSPLKSV